MNELQHSLKRLLQHSRGESAAMLAAFAGMTALAAYAGTVATQKSVRSPWYRLLRKASFQPPNRAFAPVWTGLYALMAGSAWLVWRKPASRARTRALTIWTTQLGLNAVWSWLFFGARKPKLSLAELATLFASIAAYANEAHKVDKKAAWMMAPYLGWTAFAGALNEEIARKND